MPGTPTALGLLAGLALLWTSAPAASAQTQATTYDLAITRPPSRQLSPASWLTTTGQPTRLV